VLSGIVKSIARPDGNITGQSFFNPELRAKRIELLKEVKPSLTQVAVLFNRDSPETGPERNEAMAKVANSLGIRLQNYLVRNPAEFENVFDMIARAQAGAVEIGDNAITISNVERLATMAIKRQLLSIGPKELAHAGGLIGFGIDFPAAWRRVPVFVDKILKGAKPADLPFEQASKFEFVINLKTAKALGIEVPAATLLRADEVIE
jgi:putative ABC transport system substrate-binding protein